MGSVELMQSTEQGCVELVAKLVSAAEKELAAYTQAVLELFGSEQAWQSVEDWMEELESMGLPSRKQLQDWRHLTIAAAARLAVRVHHSSLKNAAVLTTLNSTRGASLERPKWHQHKFPT